MLAAKPEAEQVREREPLEKERGELGRECVKAEACVIGLQPYVLH